MKKLQIFSIVTLYLQLIPVLTIASTLEIHQHKTRDIGEKTPVPKIELQVFKDTVDGVNVHVDVEHYVINAPHANKSKETTTSDGVLQGHAHVFVNGSKLVRLYGRDLHIPASSLQDGVNQVAVSLNSHQHENWVTGNLSIVSSVFFDLSKTPIILHNFTSQPLEEKHVNH